MATTTISLPKLLTEKEAAEYLQKSRAWLQRKRFEGGGPPYVKIGRKPAYPAPELHNWLMGTLRESTSALGD